MKSCDEGCPSYATAEEAASILKKDLGVPVCMKFLRPLGKPGMAPSLLQKVSQMFGETCDQHGEPRDDQLMNIGRGFQVTHPDPEAVLAKMDPNFGVLRVAPNTCSACKHFVPAPVVKSELSFSWPLCAAKGQLIQPTMTRQTAAACDEGYVGNERSDTLGLVELDVYREFSGAFNVRVGAARGPEADTPFVDPQSYTPDREATALEYQNCGIRGWRKFYNPKGTGQESELPMFDRDWPGWTEAERASIPMTGDDDHPEWYVDHAGVLFRLAVAWTGLDETPVLWGPAGIGKTEMLVHAAYIMGAPRTRLSITGSTEIDELVGKVMYDPERGTYWEDGTLPIAWGRPGVLIVDEPNTGQNDVWQTFRPMTDNAKQLRVNNVLRERHPFLYLGMAMNQSHDALYVGTNELSAADSDRLSNIKFSLPPEDVERRILIKKCEANDPPYTPPGDVVDRVMAIAKDIRNMIDEGTLPIAWNIRPQQKVLRLTQYLDLEDAYRMAVTDALEPETAEMILRSVRSFA